MNWKISQKEIAADGLTTKSLETRKVVRNGCALSYRNATIYALMQFYILLTNIVERRVFFSKKSVHQQEKKRFALIFSVCNLDRLLVNTRQTGLRIGKMNFTMKNLVFLLCLFFFSRNDVRTDQREKERKLRKKGKKLNSDEGDQLNFTEKETVPHQVRCWIDRFST